MFSENGDFGDLAVLGNNEPKQHGRKRDMQSKFYVFTKFPEKDMIETEFQDSLKLICEEFQYSHELCPTTNKLHFQGQMILRNRMRITQIIKYKHLNMHLSKQRGTQEQNNSYITKNTTNHVVWKREDKNLADEIRRDLSSKTNKEIFGLYNDLVYRLHPKDKDDRDYKLNGLTIMQTYIGDDAQIRSFALNWCIYMIEELRSNQKNTSLIDKYLK